MKKSWRRISSLFPHYQKSESKATIFQNDQEMNEFAKIRGDRMVTQSNQRQYWLPNLKNDIWAAKFRSSFRSLLIKL